ncbi:hypothetical protein BDEG_21340 [Batrachochytrium dendrobatidis JEL423]|uniref:RING-type domain-containing protein n=1 Tax=Batrachochytrium dendrobatidis (strain JEL423) TaxID=403673 RepID=A0A177WCH7_BATDL|nr:hypothetical protein BDEG_21340 [Batrachochytrium dendrobatidis JEL423]
MLPPISPARVPPSLASPVHPSLKSAFEYNQHSAPPSYFVDHSDIHDCCYNNNGYIQTRQNNLDLPTPPTTYDDHHSNNLDNCSCCSPASYPLHTSSTPSGIRNAVTKLKNTGLVKTRLTGSLAYRGWHTASTGQSLPVPEQQKKMAARQCNGCGTTFSKFWRSDKQQRDGWLCNNCGMNQRRGRGIPRIGSVSSDVSCSYSDSSPATMKFSKSCMPALPFINTSFVTQGAIFSTNSHDIAPSAERTHMMDINQLCCSMDTEVPIKPTTHSGMMLQRGFTYQPQSTPSDDTVKTLSQNHSSDLAEETVRICSSHSNLALLFDLDSTVTVGESNSQLPVLPHALLTPTASLESSLSSDFPIKHTSSLPSMAVATPTTDVTVLSPTELEGMFKPEIPSFSCVSTATPYSSPKVKSNVRRVLTTNTDSSKRKCGNCGTTKSAGKWRRDREIADSYLCNKCGMNQRRAQTRSEQQRLKQQKLRQQASDSVESFCESMSLQPNALVDKSTLLSSDACSPERVASLPIPIHPAPAAPVLPMLPSMLSCDRPCSLPSDYELATTCRQTRSGSRSKLAITRDNSSKFTCDTRPDKRQCIKPRPPCHICSEALPTMEIDTCNHRLCGECIPIYIRRSLKCESIHCPVCVSGSAYATYDSSTGPSFKTGATMVPVSKLGTFLDQL